MHDPESEAEDEGHEKLVGNAHITQGTLKKDIRVSFTRGPRCIAIWPIFGDILASPLVEQCSYCHMFTHAMPEW